LKGCSTILASVKIVRARIRKRICKAHSQLHEKIEEVGSKALIVVMLGEIGYDIYSFILRQFRRTGDVQDQAAQLREGRLFIATARWIVSAASLRTPTVISVSSAIVIYPKSVVATHTASCHLQPYAKAIWRMQLRKSKIKRRSIDSVAISKTVLLAIANLAECSASGRRSQEAVPT
jgi:hypothetical protein